MHHTLYISWGHHDKIWSKQNKKYKDIQLLWLTLIMIISCMKLSVVKKLSLKGMWVLIVMWNCIDDNNNNNNAIFNVVLYSIIIKNEYVIYNDKY